MRLLALLFAAGAFSVGAFSICTSTGGSSTPLYLAPTASVSVTIQPSDMPEYGNSWECVTSISTDSGWFIRLEFQAFMTEERGVPAAGGKDGDYLSIIDISPEYQIPLAWKISGGYQPSSVQTKSSFMSLKFSSDGSVTMQGMQTTATAVLRPPSNCLGGTSYMYHSMGPGVGVFVCISCAAGTFSTGGSYSCTNCSGGTYGSATGLSSSTCTGRCAAGSFSSDGASSCTPCSAGSFSSGGAFSCSSCAAGLFSGSGASSCSSCAAGKYNPNTGSTSNTLCSFCAAGSFSGSGASSCSSCAAGTFSGIGANSCSRCPAGSFSGNGAFSCSSCAAGSFSDSGASLCTLCSAGFFSGSGAYSCSRCSSGTYSSPGASFCASSCPANTYADYSAACLPCAAGTTSPAGSTSSYDCVPTSCPACVATGRTWCGDAQLCLSFYSYSSSSCTNSNCRVSQQSQCATKGNASVCSAYNPTYPAVDAAKAAVSTGLSVSVIVGALFAPLTFLLPAPGTPAAHMEPWRPFARRAFPLLALGNAFLSMGIATGLTAPALPWTTFSYWYLTGLTMVIDCDSHLGDNDLIGYITEPCVNGLSIMYHNGLSTTSPIFSLIPPLLVYAGLFFCTIAWGLALCAGARTRGLARQGIAPSLSPCCAPSLPAIQGCLWFGTIAVWFGLGGFWAFDLSLFLQSFSPTTRIDSPLLPLLTFSAACLLVAAALFSVAGCFVLGPLPGLGTSSFACCCVEDNRHKVPPPFLPVLVAARLTTAAAPLYFFGGLLSLAGLLLTPFVFTLIDLSRTKGGSLNFSILARYADSFFQSSFFYNFYGGWREVDYISKLGIGLVVLLVAALIMLFSAGAISACLTCKYRAAASGRPPTACLCCSSSPTTVLWLGCVSMLCIVAATWLAGSLTILYGGGSVQPSPTPGQVALAFGLCACIIASMLTALSTRVIATQVSEARRGASCFSPLTLCLGLRTRAPVSSLPASTDTGVASAITLGLSAIALAAAASACDYYGGDAFDSDDDMPSSPSARPPILLSLLGITRGSVFAAYTDTRGDFMRQALLGGKAAIAFFSLSAALSLCSITAAVLRLRTQRGLSTPPRVPIFLFSPLAIASFEALGFISAALAAGLAWGCVGALATALTNDNDFKGLNPLAGAWCAGFCLLLRGVTLARAFFALPECAAAPSSPAVEPASLTSAGGGSGAEQPPPFPTRNHVGEWRHVEALRRFPGAHPITAYCARAGGAEGAPCVHLPAGDIHSSHWSCCGALRATDDCTGAWAHVVGMVKEGAGGLGAGHMAV